MRASLRKQKRLRGIWVRKAQHMELTNAQASAFGWLMRRGPLGRWHTKDGRAWFVPGELIGETDGH
jgi:hypothetical protein